MKKSLLLLLIGVLVLGCLAGCRRMDPMDTTPSTTPTDAPTDPTNAPTDDATMPTGGAATESARILTNIWNTYAEEERFSAYGGAVEASVTDGPGDLDVSNAEELTARYLLPEAHVVSVTEAASLVHLMNNNIFTGVVFRLADGTDLQSVAKDLRDNVQNNRWICGQPDRLLMASIGNDQLLMVFGSSDIVDTFRGKLSGVYADATILYDESILA